VSDNIASVKSLMASLLIRFSLLIGRPGDPTPKLADLNTRRLRTFPAIIAGYRECERADRATGRT
jgi:hypothetical protein